MEILGLSWKIVFRVNMNIVVEQYYLKVVSGLASIAGMPWWHIYTGIMVLRYYSITVLR